MSIWRYQINNNGQFVIENGHMCKYSKYAEFYTYATTPSQQRKKLSLVEGEVTGNNAVWLKERNDDLAKELIIKHMQEQIEYYNSLIESLNIKIELLKDG